MENKTGIYQIKNIVNNHIYIGSAANINSRFSTHKSSLNQNRHHSIYLQRAWMKYGSLNFKFELIEECSIEQLIVREQYYIDLNNPEYNICKVAGSCLGTKGTKEANNKKSKNHAMKGKFGKDNPSSIPIYQYDLNGTFIKKWENAIQVQNTLGHNAGNIRNSVRKGYTFYDAFWSDINHGKIFKEVPLRRNRDKTKKPIAQYDITGQFIKKWNSAVEATNFLKKRPGSLSSCLHEKTKTAYEFIWKYYKETEEIRTS